MKETTKMLLLLLICILLVGSIVVYKYQDQIVSLFNKSEEQEETEISEDNSISDYEIESEYVSNTTFLTVDNEIQNIIE